MKKMAFLGILMLLNSCDDGDLQIERVDFEAVDIQTCANLDEPTETTFFFKIDQDEALLLNLAAGLLKNETAVPASLTSTLPTASNLIYRLFSENVTQSYFCDAVPPLLPTVVKENTATGGDIAIETKVSAATKDTKSYSHDITIANLSLTNDLGERLTDSSILEYGSFTTVTANSARLETPFSNYEAITDISECDEDPTIGSVRLYKSINDEFITLDIPRDSLANVATADTIPRRLNLENGIFRYVVLDTLVMPEMICTTSALSEEIENWNFNSTSGTVSIATVENEPDGNGNLSYTHTITLENLILTLQGDGADVQDAPLEEIVTVSFGSVTTVATDN